MNTTHEILAMLRQTAHGNPSMLLEAGLSEIELTRAEAMYGFRFPPDWRDVLSQVLPLDAPGTECLRFPNWRDVPNDYIQWRMDWPFEAILFDVERNHHRLEGWPETPSPEEELKAMTRATLDAAPRLIPLYSHRFLPAMPCESGNPVFSMYGTDTIIYGTDLMEYFCNEFHFTDPRDGRRALKKIPLWGPLALGE